MTYKPQDNSMMYGGYLSTSQSLPYDANVTWKSVDQQFDFDSAVKSCQSVNGAIIPDYPKSCVFADVCMTYQNGYYVYVYGFSGGVRKNNALLGRNQQQRNDVAFDVVTTTARVHSSSRFVSSGNTRTLDPEGLNQLVGFFI